MPVVMRLIMDQREISRLLVECANSPLPVEVRQFRLHSKRTTKPGQQASGSSAVGSDKDQSSYDMLVEVAGIIYIFNPPDRVTLSDAAGGSQPGAETPPPDAAGGNPQNAAVPRTEDAAGAQADEPEATPGAAAAPADAETTEGKPDESPQPN
jgi:hypothetical protein